MTLKELREKLAKIALKMGALHKLTVDEDRGFTPEELQTWESMNADFEETETRVKAAEQAERVATLASRGGNGSASDFDADDGSENRGGNPGEARTAQDFRGLDEYRDAYDVFMRRGAASLTPEQRALLVNHQADMEVRAQGIATDAAGGYTVPEGFAGRITETMQDFSGLYGAAGGSRGPTLLRTASGNTIPFPTNNDTGNVGEIIAENTQVNEQDTVFGQRTLGAFMYSSKLIRVPLVLLQDEAVNLVTYLGNILGKRLGRAVSPHFAKGTGSGQPTGLVTAAKDSALDISVGAGFSYNYLTELEHALDPAYRSRGAQWTFNDNTLKALKLLLDANNRPLWLPGDAASLAQGGSAATLKGYGYIIDQGLDDLAIGDSPIAFGDLSEFIIREVIGINLFRFGERYMDFLQIGWMGYARWDSNLIDTEAVVTDIAVA